MRALGTVFANPGLRTLELAWAGVSLATWSYVIALGVYAFEVGGPAAVGLVGLVRLLPGALASPIAGMIGDRHPRRNVLSASAVATALALAASALAVQGGAPAALTYGLAGLFTVAASPYVPAEGALLPLVSRTPQELSAANVAHSAMDNLGFLAGSALAGALLVTGEPQLVFAVAALVAAGCGALLMGLPRDRRSVHRDDELSGVVAETLRGGRELIADPRLRLVGLTLTALLFFEGAADVLVVIVALDLLDLTEGAVGYLNAAWGVGALVGAGVLALALQRGNLAAGLAVGALLAGTAMAAPGAWPVVAAAYLGWFAIGVGYTFVEVAARTLLQRHGSDEYLGRALGFLETSRLAAMALGSICVPVLIAAVGTRGTLIAFGALLPALAGLRWRALRSLDVGAPVAERPYSLLRWDPIFSPLPVDALERLAHDLVPVEAPPGEDVITQGEPGERFYLVDMGAVEVLQDGVRCNEHGEGESFGEIALLRDVPRTATVRAIVPTRLLALERDKFLATLTGNVRSRQVATKTTETRLSAGAR
jgi:MFS family permease